MMIPGIMAQRRAAGGAPVLWTPLNMATVPQIYLDAHDSVITNVSGFASAISNLGALGSDGDFLQPTVGRRPAIIAAELNGKRILRLDGVDDFMYCNSVPARDVMKNVGQGHVFAVYKKRTADAAPTARTVFTAGSAGNSQAARLAARTGSTAAGQKNQEVMLARTLDSGAVGVLAPASEVGTVWVISQFSVIYSSGQGELFRDGTSLVSNGSLVAASNTENTTSFAPLGLGASVSTALEGSAPGDIDVAAVVSSSATISLGDRQKLEGWAAHKYGLTANLPSGHPYKAVAPTV